MSKQKINLFKNRRIGIFEDLLKTKIMYKLQVTRVSMNYIDSSEVKPMREIQFSTILSNIGLYTFI